MTIPDTSNQKPTASDVPKPQTTPRKEILFRSAVKADHSTPFPPEAGRYRLYISLACPWASRCYMTIMLKGLDKAIPVTVVHPNLAKTGWRFVTEEEDHKPDMTTPEPLYGFKSLKELYLKANSEYEGRFTVPALWDSKTHTIVNNESSELIVMLNGEFNAVATHPEVDLYPESQRAAIDSVANAFQNTLNSGVYRCGSATSQEAYEDAFVALFKTMDEIENTLATSRYICGNQLTLADVRLFPTLIRFDAAYVVHFKTNWKMLKEYPNVCGYTRELYQMPAVRATVNFDHIKILYFTQTNLNPNGIIPKGPDLSYLDEPHGRDNL